MLAAAAESHISWFGRGRERAEVDGVSVFLGAGDVVLAFPHPGADLAGAVTLAREAAAREIGCWALQPDEELGQRLARLGFQDGWQPHWMGLDLDADLASPDREVAATLACSRELPYGSEHHEAVLGGDVRHFAVREEDRIVGHAVLDIDRRGATGGIYDMGVAPGSRRRGHGRALLLAALREAQASNCTCVTLNATGEGEPVYRGAGFESLGLGMTWWLFPRRSR